MNTEMVRLNISLPASINEELRKYTKARQRSRFIAKAIQLLLKQLKEEERKALLEEGYKATAVEGVQITREFEAADIENWDEY